MDVVVCVKQIPDPADPGELNPDTKTLKRDTKLILDESTTTPDLVDQNILYAKIMVKPARAIEYIAIDFVVVLDLHRRSGKRVRK